MSKKKISLLDLPIGTRFYVVDGAWYGKLVEENKNVSILVEETGYIFPLTIDHENLDIKIVDEKGNVVEPFFLRYEFWDAEANRLITWKELQDEKYIIRAGKNEFVLIDRSREDEAGYDYEMLGEWRKAQ